MGSCSSDQKSAVTVGISGQNDDLSSGVTNLACVVQGHLVVEPAVEPDFLLSLTKNMEAAKDEQKVPDEATRKESALTPAEQLALAEKEEDYDLCERLAPFVDAYLAAEAQLGVAKATKDYAQAKKAKKLLEMSFGEWTIAEERKAKDEAAAGEKVAAEKAPAEKAAAAAFAAGPKSKPLGEELNTLLGGNRPSPGVTAEALGLISKDADLTVVDRDGSTPLIWAAANGHLDCIGLLMKAGAELEATNSHGYTPLVCAAEKGHVDCTDLLVKSGAELEATTSIGYTPLLYAAAYGRTDCIGLLVKAGAEMEATTSFRHTPLFCAAAFGHSDCIGLLVKAGAELEAKTSDGDTPLHWAAMNGHSDCVGLLVKAGAELEATNEDGQTARDVAVQGKKNQWEAVVKLLDGHAVRT